MAQVSDFFLQKRSPTFLVYGHAMFLGIDFGTSAVKAVLVDYPQAVIATASVPLSVQRPAPGYSEQDPEAWWQALLGAVGSLQKGHARALADVQGIGLSGQMHGAVVLGASGDVLRPAILWNDVRSAAECAELETRFPQLQAITGNSAMPGFTAPKLLWLHRHEPDLFARIAHVLLPKAWIRYRLTGEMIEEMSDASGTLWLDVGARDWSDAALAATFLSRAAMPTLVEGNAQAGRLKAALAARWGMTSPPFLAGGAGDNAAGALALSAIHPGDAFVSLGTSGVVFATTDRFRPYPQAAVHAFCHALPNTWHQMGVTLSAASSLSWWAGICGRSEADLLAEVTPPREPSSALFLPYLGGERTPHNDADLRGSFAGLSHETTRPLLTQSVLEGVAFSLRDCLDALAASGTQLYAVSLIGGGSRSSVWAGVIAACLGVPVHRVKGGEASGAFGAARLARMAVTGEPPEVVCTPQAIEQTIAPDPTMMAAYAERVKLHRQVGERQKGLLF